MYVAARLILFVLLKNVLFLLKEKKKKKTISVHNDKGEINGMVRRWMARSAMRPAEGDTSDCILVVGISRPKMAAAFLTIVLLSLFLTFHILYDSAVYSLHAASAVEGRAVELVSQVRATPPLLFSSKVHFPRTSRHLPQAIIIGVRKCGTRALLEMLFLHPQIQKAAGEVHFFDRDDNYGKGLEWYRRKMPYSFRGQITIEKSPSYFVTPEVGGLEPIGFTRVTE